MFENSRETNAEIKTEYNEMGGGRKCWHVNYISNRNIQVDNYYAKNKVLFNLSRHDVTPQKTYTFTNTTVRTSNLALLNLKQNFSLS